MYIYYSICYINNHYQSHEGMNHEYIVTNKYIQYTLYYEYSTNKYTILGIYFIGAVLIIDKKLYTCHQ